MTARPPLQASTSSGVASAREVGFESGKMTGRLLNSAIARTTGSENAPAWPETPIRTVGLALRTTSSKPILSGWSSVQPSVADFSWRNGCWNEAMPSMPSTQQAVAIDEEEAPRRFLVFEPCILHRLANEV